MSEIVPESTPAAENDLSTASEPQRWSELIRDPEQLQRRMVEVLERDLEFVRETQSLRRLAESTHEQRTQLAIELAAEVEGNDLFRSLLEKSGESAIELIQQVLEHAAATNIVDQALARWLGGQPFTREEQNNLIGQRELSSELANQLEQWRAHTELALERDRALATPPAESVVDILRRHAVTKPWYQEDKVVPLQVLHQELEKLDGAVRWNSWFDTEARLDQFVSAVKLPLVDVIIVDPRIHSSLDVVADLPAGLQGPYGSKSLNPGIFSGSWAASIHQQADADGRYVVYLGPWEKYERLSHDVAVSEQDIRSVLHEYIHAFQYGTKVRKNWQMSADAMRALGPAEWLGQETIQLLNEAEALTIDQKFDHLYQYIEAALGNLDRYFSLPDDRPMTERSAEGQRLWQLTDRRNAARDYSEYRELSQQLRQWRVERLTKEAQVARQQFLESWGDVLREQDLSHHFEEHVRDNRSRPDFPYQSQHREQQLTQRLFMGTTDSVELLTAQVLTSGLFFERIWKPLQDEPAAGEAD